MPPDETTMLRNHVVLATRDPAEYRAFMRRSGESGVAHFLESRGFAVEFRVAKLGSVDVGLLLNRCLLHAEARRGRDASYILQFPVVGEITAQIDGRPVRVRHGGGLLICPHTHVVRKSNPGATLVVRIDPLLLRSRFASSQRRLPSRRALGILEPDVQIELRRLALVLVDAIDNALVPAGSMAAQALEIALVDVLVEGTANASGVGHAESADSRRVRMVEESVLRDPDGGLTIARLADIAGCSIRALQLSFERLCGMSPNRFVRRRRLELTHEWLQAGGVGLSVANVAARAGFTHVGNFARYYHDMFGELPRDTLTRCRVR